MNPLSYPQVLALSKGLNFFYIENNNVSPVSFSPISSRILLSDSGVLLREKTSIVEFKAWEQSAFIGRQVFGLGNPPKVLGEYPAVYSIKKCNDSSIRNILKFSYFDYFGDPGFFTRSTSEQGFFFNTEEGELAPESWMQVEKNYINSDHIVGVYAFTDTINNIKPFNSEGIPTNTSQLDYHCIAILALGNRELATEDDGFFVNVVGGGDNWLFQKANGTIDSLGVRSNECDSFIFDPFNGPAFPSGRLNNINEDYEDVKPANYSARITSMEPYGIWLPNSVAPNTPITLDSLSWIFAGGPEEAQIFRALDADVYTNAIQRCDDEFSIDNVYPFYPYSKTIGTSNEKFNDLGGLESTLIILKNTTTNYWEQGLAGTMITSGQGGFRSDRKSTNQVFLNSLSTKNKELSLSYSNIREGGASPYELVDTQRRAVASPAGGFGDIKPIEFYKAPYFDFVTNEVKGSSKQRMSCGFFSALHITPSGLIDAPQNAYSTTDDSPFSLDITLLVRNTYNNREINIQNPNLVDKSSATATDLGFASGSFSSTINAAIAGEDIKKVCGYQDEIAFINSGNALHYAGFNTNLASVINDDEVVDVALNKNTNASSRRWLVKIIPSGGVEVIDGVTGPSQIGDLVANKPQPSTAKGGFVSVDAGFDHAIVLREDGAAFAWGNNTFGQTNVPAGLFFREVKAHGNYSCGITTDNTLKVWGSLQATITNVRNVWVCESFIVVEKYVFTTASTYTVVGNAPAFVTSFLNNYNFNPRIRKLAVTPTYLIAENSEKENYIVTAGSNTNGILTVPSTSLFQDLRLLHAAKNYSLVVGETGIKAPLKEIYTKDTDEDGIDDVTVDYVSIHQASDVALVTLDSNGSVRILYVDLNAIGSNTSIGWNGLAYFSKDELIPFLTRDDGTIPSIDNEGFVKVVAAGGYDRRPCVVWLLHETGSLYGLELTSSVKYDSFNQLYKTNPLEVNFGKPNNGINLSTGYSVCYPNNTFQPNATGGSRLFIKHALNKIPKDSNGNRFPVIDIFGSYATYGGCVCANTKYTGTESELIPYQEPEIVFFPPVGCGWGQLQEDMLSKIQQRKAVFSSTGNATYIDNPNFNRELYNEVFGIVEASKGPTTITYAPPRNVFYARAPRSASTAGASVTIGSGLCVLGSNGNVTFLGTTKAFVNYDAPSNLSTFNSDLTSKGFTKTNSSFSPLLLSTIFNRGTPDVGVNRLKFPKPEYANSVEEFNTPVNFDLDTGVAGGGAIIIPGLDFSFSPSGLQTFFLDRETTQAQDFNLDSSVGSVEKQLHNTGLKLIKKIK
jgi:hypothetical protein